MRWSQYPVNTTKETPADAEVVSHQLMLRAGLIRKLAAGLYTWMPLGLRAMRKVENIVREEMNRAGALELLMPGVIPAELWVESGRWGEFGPELLRLKDRHERDFCLGPTHEEVITDIARNDLKSYRQLPANFYQIQMKFRDERRPRFGVMRAREFLMKDAYSFHLDQKGLQAGYDAMHEAYTRIFTRLGLKFRSVVADPGAIGGSGSEEFHVLADSGEDAIAFSDGDNYAANIEMAVALAAGHAARRRERATGRGRDAGREDHRRAHAAAQTTRVEARQDIASRCRPTASVVALLVRGDHELNAVKAQKLEGVAQAPAHVVERHHRKGHGRRGRASSGRSASRAGSTPTIPCSRCSDFVCGANKKDAHLTGVNWGRDLPEATAADLRNIVAGRPFAFGQGHAVHRARHRSRPHVPARPEVQRIHGRHGSRRNRQGGHALHGLLRNRCDARRCRGHRAEP